MKSVVYSLLIVTFAAQTAFAQESPGFGERKHTTLERMTLPRLKAVHEDVAALQEQRVEVPLKSTYTDYYGVLHVHASDSEHTGGTREELLRDAKEVGVDVIMLTDHHRPPRDFMTESWRGMKEGVLFIPGSEAKGYLIFPEAPMMDKMELPREEFEQVVTQGEGLIFLSHVEARAEQSMEGLTGAEIYNRHADAMDDMESMRWLYGAMTDPALVRDLEEAVKLYPNEWLAAQQDYQQVYIDAWDRETQQEPATGIAANDCHHNQVYLTKMVDENTVLVGTIVDADEDMQRFTADQSPTISEMTKGHQPGDVLAQVDFDPYTIMLRNCSTHILAEEQTEPAIRDALQAGHAYVASEWMADPTGFLFGATEDADAQTLEVIMGDSVETSEALRLKAAFPLPCTIRWMRNGEEISTAEGAQAELGPGLEPGVYRVEGWLTLDGELRPWIFSNPVYVK